MGRLLLPLMILAAGLAGCGGEAPKLEAGQPAPAFTAARVGGGQADFPRDFAGKAVVVRFWADWCRYCEGEMKAIERVYRRHRSEGLEVLAVNAGQDPATVAAFISRIGVSYPALIDEASDIARRYGVVGLPTTYFLGRDGRIRSKVVGEADEATFERLATELLK